MVGQINVKVQAGSNDPITVVLAGGATVADALREAEVEVPDQRRFLLFFKKQQAGIRVDNTDATIDQVLLEGQIVTLVPNIVAG
jgi:hypothetical protein